LVVLHSTFTAAARAIYFFIAGIDTDDAFFWVDFLANLVGGIFFLYLLKIGNWTFKASKAVVKH
jgi:hypothetical protein